MRMNKVMHIRHHVSVSQRIIYRPTFKALNQYKHKATLRCKIHSRVSKLVHQLLLLQCQFSRFSLNCTFQIAISVIKRAKSRSKMNNTVLSYERTFPILRHLEHKRIVSRLLWPQIRTEKGLIVMPPMRKPCIIVISHTAFLCPIEIMYLLNRNAQYVQREHPSEAFPMTLFLIFPQYNTSNT